MSTMQSFYTRLLQAAEAQDSELAALSQLTQVSRDELAVLKKMSDWCN